MKLVYESLKPQMEELWLPTLSELPSDDGGGDKEGKAEDERIFSSSHKVFKDGWCQPLLDDPALVGNAAAQSAMENLARDLVSLLAQMRFVNLLRASRMRLCVYTCVRVARANAHKSLILVVFCSIQACSIPIHLLVLRH